MSLQGRVDRAGIFIAFFTSVRPRVTNGGGMADTSRRGAITVCCMRAVVQLAGSGPRLHEQGTGGNKDATKGLAANDSLMAEA